MRSDFSEWISKAEEDFTACQALLDYFPLSRIDAVEAFDAAINISTN